MASTAGHCTAGLQDPDAVVEISWCAAFKMASSSSRAICSGHQCAPAASAASTDAGGSASGAEIVNSTRWVCASRRTSTKR